MEVFKIMYDSISRYFKRYKVEIFFSIAFILGLFLINNAELNKTTAEVFNDFKTNPQAYQVYGYYESGEKYYLDLYDISGDKIYSCPITQASYMAIEKNNGVFIMYDQENKMEVLKEIFFILIKTLPISFIVFVIWQLFKENKGE